MTMGTSVPMQGFSDFIRTNVNAAGDYANFSIESNRELAYAQIDALRDWCSASGQRFLTMMYAGDVAEMLANWKQSFELNVDYASHAACACLDTATELQDKLTEVLNEQIPAVRSHILAAIGSEWLPEERDTAAEHDEDVAPRRGRKKSA